MLSMKRRVFKGAWPALTVAFFLGVQNLEAVVVDGYSSGTNDRFANNPAFVAFGYDLSGVGLANSGRWLTLISPNVYLSAYHFHPNTGDTVTFYASNDPAGTTVTRTVTATAQRLLNSDLWIGVLDQPVPAFIRHYAHATEPIFNPGQFATSPYSNLNGFLFGRSPTTWPVSQDQSVGRNRLDVWFDSVTVGGTTDDALGAQVHTFAEPGYVSYEAFLQSGDSGGPLFVDKTGSGELTLAGINWFIAQDQSTGVWYNGFSYLGNYASDISAFLALYSVPEPATWPGLTACLLLGLTLWRRGRSGTRCVPQPPTAAA